MNLLFKNRFIFWVLMILVVINISALVSFFVFTKEKTPVSCCPPGEQPCPSFREKLDLSPEQTLKVADINNKYKETAQPIAEVIKKTRTAILAELEKDAPDTNQINSLTNELGLLQLKIQRENINQYIQLKHVCTPEQAQKLSALYHDLYGCPMQNGQMKHRNHHGKGTMKKGDL